MVKMDTVFGKWDLEVKKDDMARIYEIKIRIIVKGTEIDTINNSIKEFGKFETLLNGSSVFIKSIGLSLQKTKYALTRTDFEDTGEFKFNRHINGESDAYYLHFNSKSNIEVNEEQIKKMINNIQKYQAIKDTLNFLKEELNLF